VLLPTETSTQAIENTQPDPTPKFPDSLGSDFLFNQGGSCNFSRSQIEMR